MGKKLHKRMSGEEVKIHQHDNYQMPGAYKQDGDKNQNQPMFKMDKYSMGTSMRGPLDKHGKHGKGMEMSGKAYDNKMAYNKNLTAKARLHYLENEEHDDRKGVSMKHSHKGPSAYGKKHSGPSKMDPMYNGKPGVQKEDFDQFKSKGPKMRGPLNQNPCPDGKAWDDERKGCYPSKKEQAKMKTKMVKKIKKLPKQKQ